MTLQEMKENKAEAERRLKLLRGCGSSNMIKISNELEKFIKYSVKYKKGISHYYGIEGYVSHDNLDVSNWVSADKKEQYFVGQIVLKGRVFEFKNPTATGTGMYELKNSKNMKINISKEIFYSLFN